jgi:uncharacterized protein (DUF1330 family)
MGVPCSQEHYKDNSMNLTREIVLKNDKIKEDRKYSYNTPDQYYSFFECSLARLEHLANSRHTGLFISKYEVLLVEKNRDNQVIVKRFYSTQNIQNLSESPTYQKLMKSADKADLVLHGDLHNLDLINSSSNVRTLSKQHLEDEFHIAISYNSISLKLADTPFLLVEAELLENIKAELEELEKAA